jgi:adenine-specific DNA-methyltransferase
MEKKDYQNWSKEKLLHEYRELLKRKKFGIVWEDSNEDIVEKCKSSLPILKNLQTKTILTNKDAINHVFIEGDNYHALSVLNYTHRKKIDVIYIDPPYNTGSKSWKYNNRYVEKEDRYRHSKWLSFMAKRLRLAKYLLTERGVIIVAIDDYEHHTLRALMDELFGEQNRLGTIVVVHNPGGRQDDKFFATAHEYMLVYAKIKDLANIGRLEISDKKLGEYKFKDKFGRYKLRDYRRGGANSRPQDRPNLWYPIYINPTTLDIRVSKKTGYKEILPIDPKGIKRVWRWNTKTLMEKKEKYIEVKRDGKAFVLYVKERLDDNEGQKPKTFWNESYYSSAVGTAELNNVLGNDFKGEKIFDFPKSKFLVRDIIEIISTANSTILDFFAGSGTTGQAVLELNKKDDGHRQFILCTDNQDNNGTGTLIASDICYPRIKKVIVGYSANKKNIEGLGGNLRYYSTDLVDIVKTDSDKRSFTQKSTEMLCLAEATFDEVMTKQNSYSIYQNRHQVTGIVYDEDAIVDFKKEIKKFDKKLVIYVFSYDHTYNEEDFEGLNNLKSVKPIPEVILNVYRKINKDLQKPKHL